MLLLFYGRDIPEMQRYHAMFQRSMELCTDLSAEERDQLEGEALLRLSFLYFNDISAMSAYHRQIRALIPADRNPWTQGSPSVLLLYHSGSGRLDSENAEMRECMPIYSRVASGHGSGAATVMQAETEFMRGNLTDADILCRQAAEQALEAGEYSIYTVAAVLSSHLTLYEQPPRNDFSPLDRAADTLRRAHQYRLLTTVELGRGWLSALVGQTEQLPAWLTSEGSSMAQVFPLIEPIFQVIVGRVLLEQSRWTQVSARTPRLLRSCADARFVLCSVYAHLQNAVALMHLGKESDARQALCEAWSLALPDGILLPFAESDPCLDNLLENLTDELENSEAREKLHTLAERFRAGRENSKREDAGCEDSVQEHNFSVRYGLTEREMEIARLAAQRKSSREIAETLSVTVKSVNNRLNAVYEKLGLGGEGRNKRQALERFIKGS
ncbi:MAG: LuxR C-terminal-related transcriptional regulator, partial [Eubacteriales bacterium]